MPGRSGQRDCPADVTAVAKMQTNRARGVVAGVVSGADVDASVVQRPHPDESASSRIRPSLNTEDPSFWGFSGVPHLQGSGSGACVLTGGAGHRCTHERSDG